MNTNINTNPFQLNNDRFTGLNNSKGNERAAKCQAAAIAALGTTGTQAEREPASTKALEENKAKSQIITLKWPDEYCKKTPSVSGGGSRSAAAEKEADVATAAASLPLAVPAPPAVSDETIWGKGLLKALKPCEFNLSVYDNVRIQGIPKSAEKPLSFSIKGIAHQRFNLNQLYNFVKKLNGQ